MNAKQIHFDKASIKHEDIIFRWLAEPHMQEFWDNSQEHKDDILNFIHGRKQHYFYGTTQYWVGYIDDQPFSFILSDQLLSSQNLSDLHRQYLSKVGHTISLDFGIGHTAHLGKGLAAPTLQAFMEFYQSNIDPKADTFCIDPDKNNPRAIRVYEKAGFKMVGNFFPTEGAFKEQLSYLMVKQISSGVQLIKATLDDYPIIQNMARYYVYDRTPFMGWECQKNGTFECIDFKHYFENPNEKAFLVKIGDELAGFVLLDKMQLIKPVDWNMGEFFILAKFQGKGIAYTIVNQVFKEHLGKWSIAVMPENIKAVKFWRKVASEVTDQYDEVFKTGEELKTSENPDPHSMIIFTFKVDEQNLFKDTNSLRFSKTTGFALNELLFLEKDARTFGFEWPNEAMIIQQSIDECREIKEALEKQEERERIQEEIGDLLHSVISLCDFTGFDVEETLAKVNAKFSKRMHAIKKLTYELGLPNLKGQTFELMLDLWRKAKMMSDKEKST